MAGDTRLIEVLMPKQMSIDERIQIIHDYIEATGADEIDMRKVARWAMANGRWRSTTYDPEQLCARELSRAARQDYYVDPQGREVRKMHCFIVTEPNGQKRWHWVDIVTAPPGPMHKSLQSRRKQALGDVQQLQRDLFSYNDNNQYGAQLEMSFNFDEDLAEMQQPTEYPEDAGDEDENDDG